MSHSKPDIAAAGSLPGVVELTCRRVVSVVGDYLEATMVPSDRAVLEQHFLVCAPCLGYFDQYRRTVEMTRRLGDPEGEDDSTSGAPAVPDRVLALLRRRGPSGGEGGSTP